MAAFHPMIFLVIIFVHSNHYSVILLFHWVFLSDKTQRRNLPKICTHVQINQKEEFDGLFLKAIFERKTNYTLEILHLWGMS